MTLYLHLLQLFTLTNKFDANPVFSVKAKIAYLQVMRYVILHQIKLGHVIGHNSCCLLFFHKCFTKFSISALIDIVQIRALAK